MPKTPKTEWMRTVSLYRKQHPNTPNNLVFKRASKVYRSKTKTPSRSVKRTPARKTPKRRTLVCAKFSKPRGKTPRRCLEFRQTPVRHCSKFSRKSPKKCIRYSRTPLRR